MLGIFRHLNGLSVRLLPQRTVPVGSLIVCSTWHCQDVAGVNARFRVATNLFSSSKVTVFSTSAPAISGITPYKAEDGTEPATAQSASTPAGMASKVPPAGASANGKGKGGGDQDNNWWRPTESKLLAAASAVSALLLAAFGSYVALSFRERRVKAVKSRLKSTMRRSYVRSSLSGDLFRRDDAMALVHLVATDAGLYLICGPKGEGKTSLVQLLEAEHPWVIRVDLENGSMQKSLAKVAEAIGYALDYTPVETAAKAAGFNVPNLLYGIEAYEELLLVFEQACRELKSEGALNGKVPVLVLDHANRPLPSSTGGSLVYTTVEIGHRFANDGVASLVLVTSDPQHEQEEWITAGGRDSLKPIRAPPFTAAEADELLARRIHARLHPSDSSPTADSLAAIKVQYASTLNFARGAVGMRARWLKTLLQRTSSPPVPDRQLQQRGVPVSRAYFPYLPDNMRTSELWVDPGVWTEFVALITERKEKLKPLLEVSESFGLLPRVPPPFSEEDAFARNVLATDIALRALLRAAAAGASTAATTSAHAQAGLPLGITWEALRDNYFSGNEKALRALCKQHVVFYDHRTRAVEFESELMRRVVEDWLADPRHLCRIELLHRLQEWQAASAAKLDAEKQVELRKGAGHDKDSMAALHAAGKELRQAAEAVRALERDIAQLRDKLRL